MRAAPSASPRRFCPDAAGICAQLRPTGQERNGIERGGSQSEGRAQCGAEWRGRHLRDDDAREKEWGGVCATASAEGGI